MSPPVILPFLSLSGGLPSSVAPDFLRVAALVRQLDSYTFAERERAARELLRVGESAVPALEHSLRGNLSAESRERAERLVRDIRFRALKGGKEVAGLRAILRVPKEVFVEGDPITLTFEIHNVSSVPKRLPGIRAFAGSYFDGNSDRPTVTITPRSDYAGRIELWMRSGAESVSTNAFYRLGDDQQRDHDLAPGQGAAYELKMRGKEEVPAAEYEVRVTYLLKTAKEDLVSNVVRFKVVKP
jgi:hypothetical protein